MRFITLKQLSMEKAIPVSTLRELIKKGLPCYRSPGGRKIRVSPDEFDDWYRESFRMTPVQFDGDLDRVVDDALMAVGFR